MIPKFINWVETVSQPQHKKGENSLSLDKLVEKRIKEMLVDQQFLSKGDQQQILDSISNLLKKIRPENPDEQQQQQQQQQQPIQDAPAQQDLQPSLDQEDPPLPIQTQTFS